MNHCWKLYFWHFFCRQKELKTQFQVSLCLPRGLSDLQLYLTILCLIFDDKDITFVWLKIECWETWHHMSPWSHIKSIEDYSTYEESFKKVYCLFKKVFKNPNQAYKIHLFCFNSKPSFYRRSMFKDSYHTGPYLCI